MLLTKRHTSHPVKPIYRHCSTLTSSPGASALYELAPASQWLHPDWISLPQASNESHYFLHQTPTQSLKSAFLY